ncbi:TauD/TfdA family dioxygenase [Caenispirillum bisanense]|uniref:Taurine catabolism dioxygenase TauD, TfdA family n=1 Tax=Caenispirillum bisanense TaxID=414052 RepID=A0A286GCR0_9PROT|nr:TauD/TfdA family dioxygenase [Caenispirillum bisanense]SOD93325.1 Taurine catabolism dioxygenase TauD, TfdA family [Caenispirillum bisanense]
MSSESAITVTVPPALAKIIAETLSPIPADQMEADAPNGLSLPLDGLSVWTDLVEEMRSVFARHDHVRVRGVTHLPGGRVLMALAHTLGRRFMTYGDGKVVKVFSMSPWSRDLAHAGAEGFFHTDLNASPSPPALTGIQCVHPDPGAPRFGYNRVVRLPDLLAELTRRGASEAVRFLTDAEVEMANERSPTIWKSKIVDGGIVRFHPETIRAACRRRGTKPPDDILYTIGDACVAASCPISLGTGDVLLFSNHRTLHYRSECSVRFVRYPLVFEARQINVLHVTDERPHA